MFRLIYPSLYRCNSRSLLQLTTRFASGSSKTTSGSSCASSPGPSKKPNPGFEKIRKMQQLFQKDDGKPIYLKGGSKDLMLYRATMGLAVLGLLLQIHFFAMYIIF